MGSNEAQTRSGSGRQFPQGGQTGRKLAQTRLFPGTEIIADIAPQITVGEGLIVLVGDQFIDPRQTVRAGFSQMAGDRHRVGNPTRNQPGRKNKRQPGQLHPSPPEIQHLPTFWKAAPESDGPIPDQDPRPHPIQITTRNPSDTWWQERVRQYAPERVGGHGLGVGHDLPDLVQGDAMGEKNTEYLPAR